MGIALFTQGCRLHCKNCFNYEIWGYEGGDPWNQQVEDDFVALANRENIRRISFLGGEPLSEENWQDLAKLTKRLKETYPTKKIWLYSGYTFDEVKDIPEVMEILKNVDIMVDGRYVEELGDFRLHFRGSSNQRIIDMPNTLLTGEVVVLDL